MLALISGCLSLPAMDSGGSSTVNLMTQGRLGDFQDDGWEGYACSFAEWTSCVNSTTNCNNTRSSCRKCTSKLNPTKEPITCTRSAQGQTQFQFPAGGIFPVMEQFTLPPNTAIIGAANPNDPNDKTRQQTDIQRHTWFIVPRKAALCGDDPWCSDSTSKGKTACTGDPRTHRQGFLMSSNTTLRDINFQGADLGRAASEGVLCGPGAIELPGCLSGSGCDSWGSAANGEGVVSNVQVQNVRLSDAVQRADINQMHGDCNTGEALDDSGAHVRAHQVSVWVAKLPSSEQDKHSNILVQNLVSMNSRADGFNVHGAVRGLTLEDSHIENSGDDCIGVWSTGIENMVVRNMTAANCAVSAGAQSNWGSCVGTYAFQSLAVEGLRCYDPFVDNAGCEARTHWTAIHINKAFDQDCMPLGARLSLSGIEYFASVRPNTPLDRAKCGQCKPCCGQCGDEGFSHLKIDYADSSVPTGSCMSVHSGPGC